MENYIITFLIKIKFFLYWFTTWLLINIFEIQAWNIKWNFWKFLASWLMFWFLTEFSFLLIEWNFIWEQDLENEARVIVLSILIASTLYLFIPFVLRKENREKFIETTLEKFWYIKTDNNNNEK